MNWYKTSQTNNPQVLNDDEMVGFILDHSLRDWSEKLDYNGAKEIAHASAQWVLTELTLDFCNWTADPKYRNRAQNVPPIVLKTDKNEYDVLDGKHRIGMAKERGDKTIQVYLGVI